MASPSVKTNSQVLQTSSPCITRQPYLLSKTIQKQLSNLVQQVMCLPGLPENRQWSFCSVPASPGRRLSLELLGPPAIPHSECRLHTFEFIT